MKYYTNVALYGNKILLREIVDGKAEDREIEYRPTLYVTSLDDSEFKTLEGRNVDSIQPGTIKDCKDFISRYEGIQGFQVYGNTDFVYQFIADEYPGKIEFDIDHLKIAYIDIETTCDNGFPDVMNPVDKVIVISVCIRNKFTVFALGEYTPTDENVTCYCFDDEQRLLREFIHFWRLERPDIVTGWNVRFFDIPFLVNRIQKLMGDKFSRKLSPWNQIRDRKVVRMNKEQTAYDLVGISTLDYLELYQTFTYVNQESYKLDHIASVELGEKKVSYSEYDSIRDFYTNDFPKFVEYNIQDVALVQRLEDKLKLLDLSVSLAYSAKVNLMDIFSQVRTWDQIIFHYLHEKKIVIPPKKVFSKDEKYAGAYVKDPQVGKHDWVVSFDVNSLYPSLIMSFNISPETKKRSNEDDRLTINADKILERNPETMQRLKDLQALDLSVTANGCCYRKDKCGFLTDLMKTMYEDRKIFKKLMIDAMKELEVIDAEILNRKNGKPSVADKYTKMTTKELDAARKKMSNDVSKYKNNQLVRKIQLNSAYGALGSSYFRYYDTELAESITLTGQISVRWVADHINKFLNKTLGTENQDFVIAMDTDSAYLNLGPLVDRFCAGKSKPEIVDYLNKVSEKIIEPEINNALGEFCNVMSSYENCLLMGREVIADRGIWTAKKRYMLNVHDSEGVRYPKPKLKIMGIETTRSSTPSVVRDSLKEAIRIILNSDEETLIRFIDDFKKEFYAMPPEDIAFPRSVSSLLDYSNKSTIYVKATPIAVKGALLYNYYLDKYKVTNKYAKIQEGDKIKFIYLKTPNPLGGITGKDCVISFNGKLPKEFALQPYIDYEQQFIKSFIDPLTSILKVIGWSYEKKSTLEDFFT